MMMIEQHLPSNFYVLSMKSFIEYIIFVHASTYRQT